MMKKSPLQIVKERFGDKAGLVQALRDFTHEDLWVNRLNAEKGLEHVSNAKLLRLHTTFTKVKEQFGNRFKLIDAILEAQNRIKDTGLRERFEQYPVPRLFDLYQSAIRRKTKAKQNAETSTEATNDEP
jgi:hypothetical protein